MKTEAIKEYTVFLIEAINVLFKIAGMDENERFCAIIDENDEGRKMINSAKKLFSPVNFIKLDNLFIRELGDNAKSLPYKETLRDYVNAFFRDPMPKYGVSLFEFNFNDAFISTEEIIRLNFEVDFLLRLKISIEGATKLDIEEIIDDVITDAEIEENGFLVEVVSPGFSFTNAKALAEDIPELKDKLIYFINRKTDFEQKVLDYSEDDYLHDPDYGKKCDKEIERIKQLIEIENSTQQKEAAPTIKLNWTGQKNVLTDAFRRMKNKGYLTNSIPDVANFLKSTFDCFENTKQSTIEGMLKNNDTAPNAIPKEEKRIDID